MSGHFVFVRIFPGYTDAFPYDRFASLRDDAVAEAAEALRREWWEKPANRRLTEADRAERRQYIRQERAELREKVREWNRGCLLRPGGSLAPLAAPSDSEVYEPPKVPRGVPQFEEVASLAGWGYPLDLAVQLDWSHGISGRYPVAWYVSKEHANAAASALRGRLVELAGAAALREDDTWPEQMNPRLDVVAEADLLPGEAAHAKEQIRRVRRLASGTSTAEEGLVRCLMPAIVPVLEHIDTPPEVAPPPAPSAVAEQAIQPADRESVCNPLPAERTAVVEAEGTHRGGGPELSAPLTETQRKVLDALRGRAVKLRPLAEELKVDPSRLHRDSLKPLMDAGRVENDRKVGGYYRPDDPPRPA